MKRYNEAIKAREPLAGDADIWGSVDGLSLDVEEPFNNYLDQNALYDGYHCKVSVSAVFVWAPDGTIVYAIGNLPGSWADAELIHGLIDLLCSDVVHPRPFCIAGDSAFPFRGSLFGRLRTCLKLKSASVIDALAELDLDARREALALNASLISIRQMSEWGNRGLKGPFARLYMPQHREPEKRGLVFSLVTRLHNLRVRVVGRNQPQTVFNLWLP